MEKRCYDTVSEAMTGLRELGYTIDFSNATKIDSKTGLKFQSELSPKDFKIDSFYRFEGDSDPGDAMIVYAISSNSNKQKGFVVNAFGLYADESTSAIVNKLDTPLK